MPDLASPAPTETPTPRLDEFSDRLLLSPAEVARALGCGRTTVYQLMNCGKLASFHLGAGTMRRVATAELLRFTAEQAGGAA